MPASALKLRVSPRVAGLARRWLLGVMVWLGVLGALPAQEAYRELSFKLLAEFEIAEVSNPAFVTEAEIPVVDRQIPEPVRALHGGKVSLQGFMYPLKVDKGGRVSEFLLLRDQGTCCLGEIPLIHQWVFVTVKDPKGVDFTPDQPLTALGAFEVGGKRHLPGRTVSVYRMTLDELVTHGPKTLPGTDRR